MSVSIPFCFLCVILFSCKFRDEDVGFYSIEKEDNNEVGFSSFKKLHSALEGSTFLAVDAFVCTRNHSRKSCNKLHST